MLPIACDVEPPEEGGFNKMESLVLSPEFLSRLCGRKLDDGVMTEGSGIGFREARLESKTPLS